MGMPSSIDSFGFILNIIKPWIISVLSLQCNSFCFTTNMYTWSISLFHCPNWNDLCLICNWRPQLYRGICYQPDLLLYVMKEKSHVNLVYISKSNSNYNSIAMVTILKETMLIRTWIYKDTIKMVIKTMCVNEAIYLAIQIILLNSNYAFAQGGKHHLNSNHDAILNSKKKLKLIFHF